MDSSNNLSGLRQLVRWIAASAATLQIFAAVPAHADLIDQRNELVTKFVNEDHADPMVADCAAHASFVASTSNVIDHVDFPPSSFDSAHATITPWNEPFDDRKQRIKVDNVVTVEGQGIAKDGGHAPYPLKFRCGYVGTQMLAFTWNDPEPPAKPHVERSKKKSKGKHSSHSNHSSHSSKHVTKQSAKTKTTKSARKKHVQT
jgi:hypothetical protein